MKKIKFKKTEGESSWLEASDDQFLLLDYFLSSYRFPFSIQEVLIDLESILNGEKTFADIQDPNVIWSFAGGDGEFECDKDTAYFYSESNPSLNLEMPLKEVIELLKEWKAFIESK